MPWSIGGALVPLRHIWMQRRLELSQRTRRLSGCVRTRLAHTEGERVCDISRDV